MYTGHNAGGKSTKRWRDWGYYEVFVLDVSALLQHYYRPRATYVIILQQ